MLFAKKEIFSFGPENVKDILGQLIISEPDEEVRKRVEEFCKRLEEQRANE